MAFKPAQKGHKESFMVNRRLFRPGYPDVKDPLPPRASVGNHKRWSRPSKNRLRRK